MLRYISHIKATIHESNIIRQSIQSIATYANQNKSLIITNLFLAMKQELQIKIQSCRLLLVGAGGIGCEVLKNLTLAGFKNIDAVDMDTIDVSNLNRQFLFNKSHVGQSKAIIAIEQAKAHYTPSQENVNFKAMHTSITSPEFDVDFYKNYSIVINALDNRAARSHVNRMCLSAQIPLIESGTAGYIGQCKLIKNSLTACYECEGIQKEGKTYATCTIRNTPSQPIHCIVWAKHLFHQLFGEDDPDNDVSPQFDESGDKENDVNGYTKSLENGHDKDNSQSNGIGCDNHNQDVNQSDVEQRPMVHKSQPKTTRNWAEEHDYEPMKLFDKLYNLDINYLLSMDNLWKDRARPVPICLETFDNYESDSEQAGCSKILIDDKEMLEEQKLWSIKKCLAVFNRSVKELRIRMKNEGYLSWDKDDELALDFVVAASNLRSKCFNIDRKSPFDIKSLAGNIVPAISSTNSIIGGLIVLLVLRLLRKLPIGQGYHDMEDTKRNELLKDCGKVCYLNYTSLTRRDLISSFDCCPPNPDCLACSKGKTPEVEIHLCLDSTSMGDLIDKIIIETFHFVCPDLSLNDESGTIIWSKDEDDDEDVSATGLKRKKLAELPYVKKPKTRLLVNDLLQDKEMVLCLIDEKLDESEHKNFFYAKLNGKEI